MADDRRRSARRDDDAGSRRQVLGFERLSLLQDLQSILREYPDNGQIFKEMLQNAEDARARNVKIVSVTSVPQHLQQQPSDSKSGHKKAKGDDRGKGGKPRSRTKGKHSGDAEKQAGESSPLWRPPLVEMLSVPGLCVYNDQYFTEDDWKGIRKLHDSVKVKDPLKVGRFGLGFKSVFHITDHPIIVSGQHLLFMDPFRPENEAISMTPLEDLDPAEKSALRRALSPLLDVLEEGSLGETEFRGTVFWFPLRQKPSDLSDTVYTQDRVQQLKAAFKGEISTILLFLKRLERIEVFTQHDDSPSSPPVLDFSVGLTEECVRAARQQREKFLSDITTRDKGCPRNEAVLVSDLTLEMTCPSQHGHTDRRQERWAVVHFHQGTDDMTSQLNDLCQRKYLTHRPYVGVAVSLSSPPGAVPGQLFCFLPLPPENPSPTGLPLHVHGFLELSQNRQHVKWPSSEDRADVGPSDDSLVWNKLLVEQVLPRAYVSLLQRLVEWSGVQEDSLPCQWHTSEQTSVHPLYGLFPDPEKVTTHWKRLLTEFYSRVSATPLCFTHVKGGHWLALQDSILLTSPREDVDRATEEAIVQAFQACQANIVCLPPHVMQGLQEAAAAVEEDNDAMEVEEVRPIHMTMACPQSLAATLKTHAEWTASLSSSHKHLILHYLCRHGDRSLLENLELLPLADGTFWTCSDVEVHVCRDEQDLTLFPGLHHQLCYASQPAGLQQLLQGLADEGLGRLRPITDDQVPELLADSLRQQHEDLNSITVPTDQPWVRQLWHYLQQHDSLHAFDHLPLLPCPEGEVFLLRPLRGRYVCERLEGFPTAPRTLASALTRLGVVVLPSLPDFVLRHGDVIHSRVQPASCVGVLKVLVSLDADSPSQLDDAIDSFNHGCSEAERRSILDVLAAGLSGGDTDEAGHWQACGAVLRRLKLFPVWPDLSQSRDEEGGSSSGKMMFASVEDISDMTPDVSSDAFPPLVSFSPRLLHCESRAHRDLAQLLGAVGIILKDLIHQMLNSVHNCSNKPTTHADVTAFMTYFLQSPLFKDEQLQDMARAVSFVPCARPGTLCTAGQLYDPEDKLLQELFAGEDRFPSEKFCLGGTSLLPSLRRLGLRGVEQVAVSHMIAAATQTDQLCAVADPESTSQASTKAKALWAFLQEHGHTFSQPDIRPLASLRCLPCVTSHEEAAHADYPPAVPVCPGEYTAVGIARPEDMCDHCHLSLVGSVRPVSLSTCSCSSLLSLFRQPASDDVIEHLKVVISSFNERQLKQFTSTLLVIYRKLKEERDRHDHEVVETQRALPCVLVKRDGRFHRPGEFWLQAEGEEEEDGEDLDLAPYRFPLPSQLVEAELAPFFVDCGCSPRQNLDTLRQVLQEMQTRHTQGDHDSRERGRDLRLALKILPALARHRQAGEIGQVLLPIYTEDASLQFATATDCTVAPDPDLIPDLVEEEEGITFVHPDVDTGTALTLGALDLRARSLTGMDGLDIEDSTEFGQYEPLTTRLRNLLQDGYTDGFSVPKELLQNADDAGAAVVKFLVDERDNSDCSSGLLSPALHEVHGPALWVYNDAQFSARDFDNLCKLGGATKKEDCSKVGKFGLGFNAVYNMTEVPSVYSGSTMALLDPNETYLPGKKRGQKMDFNNLMNKVLLRRCRNQFRPFHGVFGCDVLDKEWTPFPATLFRFPFRTERQAQNSDILKEAFGSAKRHAFVSDLTCRGGNLMLFLQHVREVELYELPRGVTDPAHARRLVVMGRRSEPHVGLEGLVGKGGTLDQFSALWRMAVETGTAFQDYRMVETVTLSTDSSGVKAHVPEGKGHEKLECMFRVAWTTGRGTSCEIARETREEGFVPMAAVGVPVDGQGQVVAMETCPEGFYRTGHLFCFLPLAEEVSESRLPVHINAPFALTSDRRGLICESEDDRKSVNGRWNKALFSDPIPTAYLVALESVAKTQSWEERQLYYSLWPQRPASSRSSGTSPQAALFPSFYQRLVQGPFSVFLHQQGPKPFTSCYFLHPEFKDTQTGQVAFRVLSKFWGTARWREGFLIDLPSNIAGCMVEAGQEAAFRGRVITEEQFFMEVIFPRIQDKDPDLDARDRNQLVLHALLSDNAQLQQQVKSHDCIPCQPDGRLNCPERLVHPGGRAAPLYVPEDGRFPQRAQGADFTSTDALGQLSMLGMVKDKVSVDELVQRAESVKTVPAKVARERAKAIIKYLSSLEGKETIYILRLADVGFLPVMPKPRDWPLSWFGQSLDFAAPSEIFVKELRELVGCRAAVLDDGDMDLSPTDRDTLATLGVTLYKATAVGTTLTELAVQNLRCVAEESVSLAVTTRNKIRNICKEIYQYLDSVTKSEKHGREEVLRHYITKPGQHGQEEVVRQLQGQAVVWSEGQFVTADRLAFEPRDDLKPYLTMLDSTFRNCRSLFSLLGVKHTFSVEDILAALRTFKEDKGRAELKKGDIDLIYNISGLLGLLHSILKEDQIEDLHLPGQDGWLYPVSELCLNDCDWLEESDTMHFLHDKFSAHMARVFRVKTKRDHDEDEFCEAFGQQEELTTRINRLLEGYSRDASIFKELLQNADDAGATEVRFVKDNRQHTTNRLLQESWKEVCGPALCIFNDAPFTPRDMRGIQALGEGSKEGDALKTGKYGVGFNAVYNLTDTPCFWTTVKPSASEEHTQEKDLGEKLCVMDPNFFVVSRRSKLPGKRLSVNDRFKAQYSNMLAPFRLWDDFGDGTVFRLPLRTTGNAKKSRIKQPPATTEEVRQLLKDFECMMGECLLFLSSVKKVSVYTAKRNGDIELEYETSLCADDSNTEVHHEFFQHVQQEARKLKTESSALSVGDFTPKEVAVQCCLTDSAKLKTEWLVVHRFGLSHTDNLPQQIAMQGSVQKHRLLPLGGVALCLTPKQNQAGTRSCLDTNSTHRSWRPLHTPSAVSYGHWGGYQEEDTPQGVFHAYCMLPLPVNTGLPVHVNARFALDHETRRNIDTRPDNDLVVWNTLLADRVIVPAYITGLRLVRQQCFAPEEISISQNDTGRDPGSKHLRKRLKRYGSGERSAQEDLDRQRSLRTSTDLSQKLEQYSDLFPRHTNNVDDFWKNLIASLYHQLAQTEADVFPVKRTDLDCLLWVPATKTSGFPGFFWDLADHLELKEILLKLNMNIIHCPVRIYEAFQHSSVSDVMKVQEDTVISFLRSCHRPESETDTCNLKELPKDIKDTTFCTAQNVTQVFSFIHKKASDLRNLPLDLRVSGTLHSFGHGDPTLVSWFCDLLPGSSQLFLDKALIKFLPSDHGGFLNDLDVQTLARLLPQTVDQHKYGCGETAVLDSSKGAEMSLPNEAWIRRLWDFLGRLNDPGTVSCLSSWSLIPASQGTGIRLFPFKDRLHVVYVESSTEANVNRSLGKLPLNKLNTVMSGIFAIEVVASTQNPERLLTALTQSYLHSNQLAAYEAEYILDYFYRAFTGRLWSVSSQIKSLPFFERLDGTLTDLNDLSTFCLPSRIPQNGLTDWSSRRTTVLLKENNRLKDMFKQLGIAHPSDADFYTSYLLPAISDLPYDASHHHMEYIRDKLSFQDRPRVLRELRETRFIKGTDGTLCRASDFYSPDNPVFQAMLASDQFPPPPYDSYEWKSFLKELGLICDVSEDLFLRFANQVQEAGKGAVSERVAKQSQELSKYLNKSSTLRGDRFLMGLRNLQFILPHHRLSYNDVLQKIHTAFKQPTPLVSFSEAYSHTKQFLVWTSACLLSSHADPTQGDSWTTHRYDLIGFKPQPPSDIVMEHVNNVCRSLDTRGKDDTSRLTDFIDGELQVVEEVMESFYQHLEAFSDEELEKLRDVAVIFDRQRKAMFLPRQVVITILQDQVIEGHVVGAPERLGKFFDLFRRLGVHKQVTPDHYARALEQIHRKSAGNVLDPNSLHLVSKAVDMLFRLLRTNEEFVSTLTALYLPSEDISMMSMVHGNLPQVKLTDSRQLIREVNHSHQRRIKNPIKGLAVFVGFQRLGLKDHDLQREAMLLPNTYKMKRWNELVRETLKEFCRTLAYEDENTQSAKELLHSELCALVVKRLVNHEHLKKGQPFNEEDAERIDEQLKGIKVFKVRNLQTVLFHKGEELAGSEQSRRSFNERQPGDHRKPLQQVTNLFLYVDQDIPFSFENKQFLAAVHKVVSWAVDFSFNVLLDICLEDLDRAQLELDMEGITTYNIVTITTVFPPPGSFVHEDMHFLLDQGIYEFKVGEYAAYELYDPVLEETEVDDSSDGDPTGRRQKKQPSYIFAKVKKVIAPDGDDIDAKTRVMRMRYVIDVGEEELKEVDASELYKFITPSPNVVAPFTGQNALPSATDQPNSQDLKAVLKDIRRQLRTIWRTFDNAQSRKRAVKRLLLVWHPDKNPGQEEFCTQVFQYIQNYVQRLERGEDLPSDDEDVVDGHRSSGRGERGFSSFFDDIFDRGQTYANCGRESYRRDGPFRSSYSGRSHGGGSYSGHSFNWWYASSRRNPQPEEGRRWMRQAKRDLQAARQMLQHGHVGGGVYNWPCYQAHQTVEKALKAVLYRRDANSGMKNSHDICDIACSVDDSVIMEKVDALNDVVRYHTRMRYPDLLEFPKIPSDVYCQDEARQACDLAEAVMNRAEQLFDEYRTPPPSPPPPPRQPSPPPSPRPCTSYHAIHSSSSSSGRALQSSSSNQRPAISSQSGGTAPKVPRLDPPLKALPPP